jgi:putative transposase
MELKTFNHAVGQNSYHFVWCPRFRHKIFKHADLKFACKNILHAICRKYDFEIFELEIGIDHIHLFVDITPKISISKAFQLLKGISSRMIFKSFPDLLYSYYWKGGMWSRGKFFRSVGNVTSDVIRNYINQQNDPKCKFDFKAYIRKARLEQQRMKAQKSLVGFCA